LELAEALNLKDIGLLSAVGGGGKTSLIFKLARELKTRGKTVLVTTTTKIYLPPSGSDITLILESDCQRALKLIKQRMISEQTSGIEEGKIIVWGKKVIPGEKMEGVRTDTADRIYSDGMFDFILVEADGAKRKPVKAPASHEPQVPRNTTHLLGIVGLDAVGMPLSEDFFHRPELVYKELAYSPHSIIDEELISFLVTWENGLFKNAPINAQKVLVLNKADDEEAKRKAERISKRILMQVKGIIPDRIIFTSLITEPPVMEVFL
jgi:probable selenium-dependent hydroxylase accessory protein YqeC